MLYVIFFDLINVFVIFHNIMNDILRFFLDKFVIVYFDNILIYFKNNKKHLKYVRFEMKIFHKNYYYVKSSIFFLKNI